MIPTNLYEQLKRDEGYSLTKYLDSKGIPTIGIGHNLHACPNFPDGTPIPDTITDDQCEILFQVDVQRTDGDLYHFLPWALQMDPVRQAVLRNMAFNMGMADQWPHPQHGLMTFPVTLSLIQHEQWNQAGFEMLQSQWAKEVGARAHRLSQQIITGEWQ